MKKSNEEILALFKRIKKSGDGPEFLEYLEQLSKDNYESFKGERGSEFNEYYKGCAVAIDKLINNFAQCDKGR